MSLIPEYKPTNEIAFPVVEEFFAKLSPQDVALIERVATQNGVKLPPREQFPFWRAEIIRFGVHFVPDIAQRLGLKSARPPANVHNMHTLDIDCGSLYDPNLLVEGMQAVGVTLTPGLKVLDFGCSSGRVLRSLAAYRPQVTWIGCDPESDAVNWAAKEFPQIRFFTSPRTPPLPVPNADIDFVYAISIWSHFREDAAIEWLAEMARIIKPGGHLWLSTHGLISLADWMRTASSERAIQLENFSAHLLRNGFVFEDAYRKTGDWGADTSWWGMAHFTPAWMARQLIPHWRLAYYRPAYLAWNQDVYILQRR